MEPAHIDDLKLFLVELRNETDRGLPLVGTALIDEKLRDTLEAFFINNKISSKLLNEPNSPLGTFSSRIDCCYALGLINEFEFAEINLLRKIRNEFAHTTHGITFKSAKVAGLCSSLKSELPEGAGYPLNDPRFRFTNSIVCIICRLYYRPAWVFKEKRSIKNYGEEEGKWVSVKDQLPPDGVPVLVMTKKQASPE